MENTAKPYQLNYMHSRLKHNAKNIHSTFMEHNSFPMYMSVNTHRKWTYRTPSNQCKIWNSM